MALDASTFTAADSTGAEYEAGARQLVTSGLVHLRQYPNPQLATEAMLTGASGDVSDAMSDPELAPYMGATPTGKGLMAQPDNGHDKPGENIYRWDKDVYEQQKKAILEVNPGWKSFGDVPATNLGWMDTVRHADPNTIKKWQGMMSERGFYDGDPNGHHQTGRWDPQKDEVAFREFMLSYAMPTALWAKNDTVRNQARAFMQALGADPTLFDKRSADPSFNHDVALRWIQSQGHDNQADSLHEFADRFGADHLPSGWQQAAEGGSLGEKALETVVDIGKIGFLPLTLGEKLFGSHAIQDFVNQGDPAYRRKFELAASLNSNDRQVLAPALDQIGKSEGFLPFSWFDRQKAHVALAAGYTFQSLVKGRGVDNPFDPASDVGKRIHENEDDLVAAVMGKQWVKDHPGAAEIANLAANTLDDPTVWMAGPLIRAPKLAADLTRAVGGGRKLTEAVDSMGAVRSGLGDEARAALGKFVNPRQYLERAHSEQLFRVKDDPYQVHSLLGVDDEMIHEDADPDLRDRINRSVEKIRGAQSAEEVRQELHDNFRHVFHTGAGALNRAQALQSLTPTVSARMGAGWLTKHRTMGGFMADSNSITLDQKMAATRYIEEQMHIVGHDPTKIAEATNEFFALPQNRRQFWINEKLPQLLDDGPAMKAKEVTTDAVRGWHDEQQRGGYDPAVDRALGPVQGAKQTSYLPAQRGKVDPDTRAPIEPGTEMSRAPREYPPAALTAMDNIDRGMKARQYEFRIFLDNRARDLMKSEPMLTMDEAVARARRLDVVVDEQARLDAELAEMQQHLHEIAPLGATRPAPAFTSQLSRLATFKVSSYELASYLNRGLHAYEDIAAATRADSFYRMWKPILLMRPATAARVAAGDDIIRFAIGLATEFHAPVAAVRLLGTSIAKSYGSALQSVARGLGDTVADVADKVKGRTEMERKIAAQNRALERDNSIHGRAASSMLDSKTLSAMTLSKQIQEVDPHVFVHYEPGQHGYERGFATWFQTLAKSPEVKAFAEAFQAGGLSEGRRALRAALAKRTPANRDLLEAHKADLDTYAEELSRHLADQMRHPEITKWYVKGHIDHSKAGALYKNQRDLFPVIAAPRDTLRSRNVISRLAVKVPQAMFHAVLEPMIATARAEGAIAMREKFYDQMVKTYGKDGGWSEKEMRAMARAQTYGWMRNNTYQGQRTIMGRAMRHTFPFWGATANMSRFFLRQARLHPRLITPGLRAGSMLEQQAGNERPVTFGGNILQALGFSGGDSFSMAPSHALFFTADGLGSFMPGLGPIYAPILAAVDRDQTLKDTLSQIPGLREQLGYQAGSGGHPLIGFVEQALSAAGLMSPWHRPFTIPILGGDQSTYDRRIDAETRRLYVDYQEGRRDHPPTADEAASALGTEMMTGAAMGAVVPMLPKVQNVRDEEIRQASDEMRAATTDQERDRVIANHQAVAPLLRYHDPRTPLAQKDDLVVQNPWLAPYVTSMYSTQGTRPSTLAEYDAAISSGNMHVLGVDSEFVPAIEKHRQFSEAYARYTPLKDAEETYRKINGVSAGDPDYRQWVAANIAPRVQALMEQYPLWAEQFLKEKNTTLPGLEANTAPIRALATWEVVPAHPGLENDKSIAWREALVRVNDAATALNEARANREGAQVEAEIIDSFNQILDQIAAKSPGFAAQLASLTHSKFDDFVKYEVAATGSIDTAEGAS